MQSLKPPEKPCNGFNCDILESISDGVFTVDDKWLITSFNRAAEQITGISRNQAMGRPCWEVFHSSLCESECALRYTMESGKPVVGKTCYFVDSRGRRITVSVSTSVLSNDQGEITGGVETFRDLSALESLRLQLKGGFDMGELISHSPAMQKVLELTPAVAETSSTVLIQGETGTGKELVARAIHSLHRGREAPFVAVNCAALPDTLLESELFGYKAGAFTGAEKSKPGRFAQARGGTLFLDEIGDMSLNMQTKLLRVLQDRSFEPLGAVQPEKTDARIIAASNKDLEQLVEMKAFRQDLFYRINVVRIDLPPLRERKEDIPFLVDQFIERFNRLYNREITGVDPQVLSLFMAHDWPGNIRELENVIERAFVLCRSGEIQRSHLPRELIIRERRENAPTDLHTTKQALEAANISRALKQTQNSMTRAARLLGMHRSTLYRKMKQLGLIKM
ncbi:PAS modulated sigma54 specific transcriptional regulator, Fis family [Desulfonatronospira thiodismutans ASO3-1]|uniref:PAS modulated sigma54 specific transcriptional regulator, Fis family n=1 Tax=Desulfonatronospira thiodismutans ASO3-1 TaxID=555779 RepID=D6SND5_9BACT|nr:sigma-54-dependent Fis family transcriptional regulator [Desulfonatronospira thiodismutans]EFI34261.1 PAS modulated sigma54 specific transcriptional regulator, Fis family [Desulfonatronospira thiodismutans ASO3-1]